MPWKEIGEVVGKDGGFGNVTSEYVDDGGEPSVDIEASGEDTAKDFKFTFKNLINQALDSSTIDQILNDAVVKSANVLNGTGLVTFFAGLKNIFAAKSHTHNTDDIDDRAITSDKIALKAVETENIADGAVGETQLDTALRNSIFQGLNDPILPTSYLNNVLLVSPDPDHWTSKPCRVVKDPGAGITAYGLPGELESASTIMCVRYVQIISDKHIAVWLFGNFPSGRIWTNFYNNYVWDGWRQI
jgi:hypothetical protein